MIGLDRHITGNWGEDLYDWSREVEEEMEEEAECEDAEQSAD